MAKEVLTDATILYGSIDLSSYSNQITIDISFPDKPATTYGSGGWEESLSGLPRADVTIGGFDDQPEPNAALWSASTSLIAVTRANPVAEADGVTFFKSCRTKFTQRWQVGEIAAIDWSGYSTASVGIGKWLQVANASALAAPSSPQQLGAVSSTKVALAGVWVTAFTGTSLDLVIESDNASGFSSPTTRFTFTQITGTGYEILPPLQGAITDDYWRVTPTFTGTSCSLRVALAIQ